MTTQVICAWCGKVLRKDILGNGPLVVSHGICKPCAENITADEMPERRKDNGRKQINKDV